MATHKPTLKNKPTAIPSKNALVKHTAKKSPKPGVTVVEDWEVEIIPRSAGVVRLAPVEGSNAGTLSEFENAIRVTMVKTLRAETAVAMNSVLIGIALARAEAIFEEGYLKWVEYKLGDLFGRRKAFYCKKLGDIFYRSEEWKTIKAPPVRELGGWLVRENEYESPFKKALANFVGDMNLTALMEKHGVCIPKAKKEWVPHKLYVDQYTRMEEHRHLADIPYTQWDAEEKEAFKAWYDEETKDQKGHHATKVETARKTWERLGDELIEEGLTEKTWAYIPPEMRKSVLVILKDVVYEMEAERGEDE